LKERDRFEDVHMDGMIILKCIIGDKEIGGHELD